MRIAEEERDALRLRRLALRLTQDDLAAELDVSPSTISLWESGSRSPRGPAIRAWRRALEKAERRNRATA